MMNEQNGQFDNVERGLPDRLRTDLQGLFAPPGRVPPQVDRAIMDQARRRLAGPRRIILRLRWAGGIAAAAAVIVIGFVLLNPQSEIRNAKSSGPDLAEGRDGVPNARHRVGGPLDIDGNGRVDILDAFRLARHIESRGPARTEWDLNGDGRVDRQDVDLVAFAAVRLGSGAVGCVPRTAAEHKRWCVIRTLPGSPSQTRRGASGSTLDKGV
jgi:hypothetical protein